MPYGHEASDYTARHLSGTSATFGICIQKLDATTAHWISLAYLIARTFDSIEDCVSLDHGMRYSILMDAADSVWDSGRRHEWLRRVEFVSCKGAGSLSTGEAALLGDNAILWKLVDELPQPVIDRMRSPLDLMALGMADFVREERRLSGGGFRSVGSLFRYCYCVAGVVGHLLTDLFLYRLHGESLEKNETYGTMHSLAPSFGFAMQLSNMLKNLGDDLKRGVCFLPSHWFRQFGTTPSGLLSTATAPTSRGFTASFIRLILPTLTHAIQYVGVLQDLATADDQENNVRIRQFLMLQLILVMTLTKKSVANPELAFFEGQLQPRAGDVGFIERRIASAARTRDAARRLLQEHLDELRGAIDADAV